MSQKNYKCTHSLPKIDFETDVLIIGYGAAGANAAIAAHDAGARVSIIEKLNYPGGNSGVCAGAMLIPNDIEQAVKYYRSLSFGTVDEEMIHDFAEAMVGVPELLKKLGAEFKVKHMEPAYFPRLLDGKINRIQFSPTGAEGFRFLQRAVEDRNINIFMNTQATGLIQDHETGAVLGARIKHNEKEKTIFSYKGVLLACGGYEYNPTMLANFNVPGAVDYIFPWGTPGNTGDGVKLAIEAGAALWHMASIEWGAFCARKPSLEFGTAIGCGISRHRPNGSYLFVNKYGKRFMAESTNIVHRKAPLEILSFDHENAEYKNLPAYMIFDDSYLRAGPIASTRETFEEMWGGQVGYPMIHNIYEWSPDNRAEIDKGWVLQAQTLKDLGEKLKIDSIALEETVRSFNGSVKEGWDNLYERKKESLAPLDSPPYYAVELALTLTNTQGGPKRNKECQVLDFDDKPIPKLYAAGELGSFFGFLYQGGSNYPEAFASGQIAGNNAAAERPWNSEVDKG